MFDLEDSQDYNLTSFDISRLKDMGIGGRVESENGAYVIFRYKGEYALFVLKDELYRDPSIAKFTSNHVSFSKLEDLINNINKKG